MDLDSTWPDTISMVFSHEDPLDIVLGEGAEESAIVAPSNPESDGWALMGLVLALWGLLHSRRLNAA
ncbi:hypothetical protein DZC73_06870 [Albitalea terrae]|uniref:Uncharacterized protein n=1 Tax=Piscinibacter terrae TaxID=2496871 RepID=A0A3N7HXS3_9BURK|nr:hypothetical protein DZC73_06870 [Albitalea terrae]